MISTNIKKTVLLLAFCSVGTSMMAKFNASDEKLAWMETAATYFFDGIKDNFAKSQHPVIYKYCLLFAQRCFDQFVIPSIGADSFFENNGWRTAFAKEIRPALNLELLKFLSGGEACKKEFFDSVTETSLMEVAIPAAVKDPNMQKFLATIPAFWNTKVYSTLWNDLYTFNFKEFALDLAREFNLSKGAAHALANIVLKQALQNLFETKFNWQADDAYKFAVALSEFLALDVAQPWGEVFFNKVDPAAMAQKKFLPKKK